ncbi:MAG: carbohydrate ABC transporter permease [Kiritimatiellae bacterium]|nr:carbohydrate ABC transporter permease [Kiritimatiellia bacterium]
MGVLLPSERGTAKGRLFLAFVYGLLALGGVTMALPFMVMISSSFATNYDYSRHEPVLRAFWNRNDRFMRAVATCFPRFPRDVFPEAPETWTGWTTVAKDRAGVDAFANALLDPMTNRAAYAACLAKAEAYRDGAANWDVHRTTCNYDPRDVEPFTGSFTTSFLAESRLPVHRDSWTPPEGDGKYDLWCRFKRSYVDRMLARGDFVCRTVPAKNREGLREALVMQFCRHGTRDFWEGAFANYRLVGQYLFIRGRAFWNTVVLVLLSVLASLVVNPLAAYALSRFNLRGTEKIILFLLATMAFPAAVTAIPGFLLIRDLGLLNTFAALVLPTVASGMSVFIMKGFFDALPRELYEAAAIDGAGELRTFFSITLPMTTPILAVNALNHFIAAYNSWEWAFLVCQNESKWTIAVWMYQMSQQMAGQPWCVMAGFVLVSLPTAAVFLLCQKIILRGIVLPSMK